MLKPLLSVALCLVLTLAEVIELNPENKPVDALKNHDYIALNFYDQS